LLDRKLRDGSPPGKGEGEERSLFVGQNSSGIFGKLKNPWGGGRGYVLFHRNEKKGRGAIRSEKNPQQSDLARSRVLGVEAG